MRKYFARFSFLFLPLFLSTQGISLAQSSGQKVVTGTILVNDKAPIDNKALLNAIRTTWKLKTDSLAIGEKTIMFNTSGDITVMIAHLMYPAALDEIGAAARLSTLWKSAGDETRNHQSQIVISVMGPANRTLDMYKIFTQAAAATLQTTRSPGIYLGSQYLLLSNGFFTAAAQNMLQNQTLPLYCWVYFGMPGGSNAFTYGLKEFGLPEMEIVNSTHSAPEVHSMMYDATMSVIKYGTHLKDGQFVVTEEGSKVPVHLSKAAFVEGQQVLKLDY